MEVRIKYRRRIVKEVSMHVGERRLMWLAALALLFSTVGRPVLAEDRGPVEGAAAESMVLDLVLLRPLGLVATVAGGAIYIVSLPFSLAGGNARQAGQRLVSEPARFTFVRPLGDLRFTEDWYQ